MKIKIVLIFLLASTISLITYSQSVYHIQYNFHTVNDTTSYNAFLIKYNNGNGLLRVRYKPQTAVQDLIAEMDIEEQYLIDKNGIEDTNTLILIANNPRIIDGDTNTQIIPPVFLFGINTYTEYFEPKGVGLSETNPIISQNTTFTASLLDQRNLTKPFVFQFFDKDKDEEFLKTFFKPKTRGGFSLIGKEKETKLHLLIVADVNNSSIGAACKLDIKRAQDTFDSLAKYMGIQLIPKIIYDKTFSKQNVEKAIAGLKPLPNDIVVFYYSGHGFRIPESPRRFPYLKLKNFRNERKNFRDSISWIQKDRQDNITYSLNIEDIYNSIKVKGARFSLVLSDCCNEDIFAAPITNATKPGKSRGVLNYSENNVRDLFLNKNRMSILATAASEGQKATCNNDFGGFFSYYFKATMETFASKLKNRVNWDQIFMDAKKQTIFKANHTLCDQTKPMTPEKLCKQEPDYQILIEN